MNRGGKYGANQKKDLYTFYDYNYYDLYYLGI